MTSPITDADFVIRAGTRIGSHEVHGSVLRCYSRKDAMATLGSAPGHLRCEVSYSAPYCVTAAGDPGAGDRIVSVSVGSKSLLADQAEPVRNLRGQCERSVAGQGEKT